MLSEGLIQVYVGDGKGKTSAALGQALRASGRGLKVLMLQFFKPAAEPSGELLAGSAIEFRRGTKRHPFFDKNADREAIKAEIRSLLGAAQQDMVAGNFDLVVLDEVNNALRDKLLEWPDFEVFLKSRPKTVELVCTGRGAPEALIALADYVTEFKKIKHPIDGGKAARKGIEF